MFLVRTVLDLIKCFDMKLKGKHENIINFSSSRISNYQFYFVALSFSAVVDHSID